jgi:hypothetical protein
MISRTKWWENAILISKLPRTANIGMSSIKHLYSKTKEYKLDISTNGDARLAVPLLVVVVQVDAGSGCETVDIYTLIDVL